MKNIIIFCTALLFNLQLAAQYPAHRPAPHDTILLEELKIMNKTLRAVKSELSSLRKEVEELKKQLKKQDDLEDVTDSLNSAPGLTRGPKAALLKKIRLPENPTEKDIERYIAKIIAVTQKQNCFSPEDPQVKMLVKLGKDHIDQLIKAARQYNGRGGLLTFHVKIAINRLADEKHKKIIIDALPYLHSLTKAIINHGWEKDAADILKTELESNEQQLPSEWIQAVANLNDKSTYDALKQYLVNHNNRYANFQIISQMPDMDLTDTVKEMWEHGADYAWEKRGIAKIAVQYGNKEALRYLVDFLNNNNANDSWDQANVRQLLLRHLDFYGSNKTMEEWLTDNYNNIIFDKKTKKFKQEKSAGEKKE